MAYGPIKARKNGMYAAKARSHAVAQAQARRSSAMSMRRGRAGYATVARTRGWAQSGEMKYFDLVRSAAIQAPGTDWAGCEVDPATDNTLFCPVQGTDFNSREGKKALVYKIRIRGTITVAAQSATATADAAAACRIILMQDTQTNSTQIQAEEVMAGSAAAATTFLAPQDAEKVGRAIILKDKTYVLQNPTMAGEVAATNIIQSGLVVPFKFNVVFKKPVAVNFNGNAGTVADIVNNSWHIWAGTTSTALAPTINYWSRVCFKS